MTEPFIGQIQMLGFPFAPVGWAFCNGATVNIQQSSTLYALLGTQYGGNGTTNFQLPNLMMRAAASQGTGPGLTPRVMGQNFGAPQIALSESQMPAHRHTLNAYSPTDATRRTGMPVNGGGLALSASNAFKPFSNAPPNTGMSPAMLTPAAGGNQPHDNQQPYLAVNFCIALQGVFPSFQ
ncbi:MAG: tail fiber protein [Stenotrophomonas sp.]|uniref:phage tail protein n=1 Tax=Stenotrophomonas sp. TaxID=69392 RepID=UPI002FC85C72